MGSEVNLILDQKTGG